MSDKHRCIVFFLAFVSACGGSSSSSETGATADSGSGSGGGAGAGGAGLGGAGGAGLGGAGGGGTGGAGLGGSAGSTGCPGTGGPTMVKVPGGYCIDSTEVTRDQYLAWLASNPSTSDQPSYCSWNTDFVPGEPINPVGGDRPITLVDWCDARGYCMAVGKRLCGKIGGGTCDWDDVANATASQWYNACSSGGKHLYPYGDVYHPNGCNGDDNVASSAEPAAVAAFPDCVSDETS
ncbi:MAG TPA: SUMF1/EgtB/PvdO family nonheme iron enzyme [Polyangiaceae bacterium]|nr:SUMF1/EgtB/PvdO family nonheme iron enzyme [Polyangiaceae bacterium]